MIVPSIKEFKVIPTLEEGNTLFPLPPDYNTLTIDGKRQARVNACCQQYTPEMFVYAWEFFRRTYLFPMPPGTFYGDDLVESPPMHYDMVRSMAAYSLVMRACPRGSAKSTIIDEVNLMLSLTYPGIPTSLILASDQMVKDRFSLYMDVLGNNEYIIRDFGVCRPNKGSGAWNLHHLLLRNGSRLKGSSVDSKKRGMKPRPIVIFLDDPEYDPKQSTDTRKLRREFESLLFRVLIPMGQRNVKMIWFGTMINKQASLYSACQDDDPRFRLWNREIVSATYIDKDGQEKATWDSHMSLEFLEQKKIEIGASAYASEYLNRPGIGESATFIIDETYNTYTECGEVGPRPLESKAIIKYSNKSKDDNSEIIHKEEASKLYNSLFRISLMDYAPTVGPSSDYSSIVTLGFQRTTDIMFILDCWVGKLKDEGLIQQLLRTGMMWRPRVIGIESVAMQRRFYELASAFFSEHTNEANGWKPIMYPVMYRSNESKRERIAGMQWRFSTFKVKFPASRRNQKGMRDLFYQVENFIGDLVDGNLQNDDAIDAMAMYQQVTRSTFRGKADEPFKERTPLTHIMDGEIINPLTGLPYVLGVRLEEITKENLAILAWNHYNGLELNANNSLSARLDMTKEIRGE